MTSPSETATDHQIAAEEDEDMLGRIPDPAGPLPSGIGRWTGISRFCRRRICGSGCRRIIRCGW
jgi:hypothetical protein